MQDFVATREIIWGITGDEDDLAADGQPFDPETDYITPHNSAYIITTHRLVYSDGRPVQGRTITMSSQPLTLTGPEWRTVDGLVARWPSRSAEKLRQRISEGVIRLSARITPTSAVTDAAGYAKFRIDAWHVCGAEADACADFITSTAIGYTDSFRVRCGLKGLALIPSERESGLEVTGTYYLLSSVISLLKRASVAWRDTKKIPETIPNYFTITDGSLRWGGLHAPHMTHRLGGTVDIRPISTDGQPTRVGAANYSRAGTAILAHYCRLAGATQVRFADNLEYVTIVDPTHTNHLHVSWLRRPEEPWLIDPGPLALQDWK